MAPRHHADSSRYDRDHRDRGGGRRHNPSPSRRSRSPPRRDRSRDRSRDRRDRSRDRGDRYSGSHRDDYYRGSNRNRDTRRDRESYGRLRSPNRRERSRDRHSGYRGEREFDRSREYSDRDHNRGYNDREHNDRDRRRRSFSHSSRPGSRASATPGPQSGRDRDRIDGSRRDEKKKDPETEAKDKQAEKLARLAEWKKRNAERLAKDKPDTPGSGLSPNVTAPSTPTVATTPSASENKDDTSLAKAKVIQKSATEKLKQKQPEKSTFKLDASATARPLMAKAAGKPVTSSAANNIAAQQAKANGNIGSFGLKNKSAVESETAKNSVLGDEDNTGKRKFQALPEFTPNDEAGPAVDDADDAEAYAAMSDIGSDDEDAKAQLQAQLEKRREELAAENLVNEDTAMDEAPPANDNVDKMDVDQTAEEDEVDPLDAYMAGLSEPQPARTAPAIGQAMFADDLEPEQTSVEAEDLIALKKAANAKKKKKEVPVVDHSKIEYEPFRKDFYVEPAEITQMTTEEVADLRHDLDGIKVKPGNVPRPVVKWAQMGLLQATMDVFTKLRFEKPTSIQSQAIPIIESGRDLVGIAKTGSGKTLAFGIPMIRHILDQRPLKSSDGPIGLILAPTRELSLQIVAELKPFLSASGLTIKCAYGGSPIADQIAMLKRGGIHVLCATAGRLIDLLASNSGRVLNFKRVTYVVLDEADRMFDMGFEPQVMKIIQNVRPDRQTILFSATFPKDMASLARKALTDSAEVTIGGRSKVAPEITQIIDLVPPSYEKKVNRLLWHLGKLFSEQEDAQILIFTQRQEVAEDLLSKLFKAKYPLTNAIHGAKEWSDRIEAMNAFKKGDLQILIATSVAARGLDVPGLAMVLNFDCPTHLEDYVHRCGRTGRAGNKGTAVTLVEHPGQERFAVHIVKALKESDTEVPEELQKMADSFLEKVKAGEEKYYGGFGGRGIERLDAARALEKRREKRALKLDDDDESEEEVEELPKPEVAAKATDEPQADTRPSWMKLLDSKIVVSKTERPDPSALNKNLTAREKAALAASKVDGRLSKKGMIHAGQPIDNKGPDAGAYHSTVEINDFPQKARWAVTNRTNVAKILDQTGVSITTKGEFYPAGKEPGENEKPKLYILVEGDTENIVTEAMMELTRLLREGTMAEDTGASARGPTGRYNVV